MKIFWLILILLTSLYANDNNKDITERVIKLEVQIHQLEKTIDSRSGLLKEKQEIFLENEKRLNGLYTQCNSGLKEIENKTSEMDEKFRGLYSKANYGIIGFFSVLILAIIFICKMLNKSLDNLEENYKHKISDLTTKANRQIQAVIQETGMQIRKYQDIVDNQNDHGNDEEDKSSSNPF